MVHLDSVLKKQRHHSAHKGPYSQSFGFFNSYVWMWELDYKESWVLKNWCFLSVVLEKTLKSLLDCKEIKSVHPKGNQPWIFIGRTDAEAESPILWSPDAGKDRRWEEKGTTEDEMVGWHHWFKDKNVGKLQETVRDREAHHAAVYGVAKSRTWLGNRTTITTTTRKT